MTSRQRTRTAARSRSSPAPAAASATASPRRWSPAATGCASPAATRTPSRRPSSSSAPTGSIGVAGKAHDEAHQAVAVERTMEAFGRVDYLVNNAGTNPVFGPIADLDLGVARKVFETNVSRRSASPSRPGRRGRRRTAARSSTSPRSPGSRASPFIGAYGMSKAAMVNLTAAARARVRARGAGQRDRARRGQDQVRRGAVRGPRGGGRRRATRWRGSACPEDIGGAAAFLTSDAVATGSPARRSSSTAGSSSTRASD